MEILQTNGFEISDAKVVINAQDPNKVYLEPFTLNGYEYSQYVAENGFSTAARYGKLSNGTIIIPKQAFRKRTAGSDTWQDTFDGYRELVISLPEDYFNTPSTSGVYFGITAFNYDPEMKPIELLNKNNKVDFKKFVNEKTMDDATYLYYSVDVALKALGERNYPEDLKSVALITFTDGNDDGSLEKADPTWGDTDYQNYLKTTIGSKKIQNIPVKAFSIGLKGKDIGDYNYDLFKSNLKVLASADDLATEANNIAEVENTLNKIIDDLQTSWFNKKVTCSINTRATGDRVRFTFDKSREEMNNDPDNSELYVEGVFSRTDNSLNDVTYHGFKSTSGNKVSSVRVENNGRVKYSFTFENLQYENGDTIKINEVNYWHQVANSDAWQPHTEFSQGTDANVETERTSAAIMFVMDCSTSLGDDFTELQRVVNSLIDRLCPDDTAAPTAVVQPEYDENAPTEYYTLSGIRIQHPHRGIYIVRKGGKVRKMYIK